MFLYDISNRNKKKKKKIENFFPPRKEKERKNDRDIERKRTKNDPKF